MSYTYIGATGLVTLPDREVQTFPSGLVRVTRRYVVRKDNAQAFAGFQVGFPLPNDDGAPAIDGLYIFPEPQEIVRDDGFVEFRVTAYGRTSTGDDSINIRTEIVKGNYTSFAIVDDEIQQFSPPALLASYIITAVVPANSNIDDLLTKPNADAYVRPILPGGGGSPLKQSPEGSVTVILWLNIDGFRSINYGSWNEVTVTWVSSAVDSSSL